MKIYEKNITDIRGQLYAVHDGPLPGTVRIARVGGPPWIELDAVAARQLHDALGTFLSREPPP
jgi:hypothetical protein